ncbi:PqqD family protein [Chitinophaga varians]|uniref:PqqD family protein n=1 Tax=Chitinophaga varians TaxID=2202339 RepID=UPI00165ED654|nr:PqqD family protein [Chitinophaga varians]MBC9909738.1 PqqD family protein [Chitinophaga varians]
MIFLEKQLKISENSIVREMGDGYVILNVSTEHFYELNDVGKRFWELLADNKDYDAAFHTLQEEYAVSPDRLQADLFRLIEDLRKAELITCC